MDDKSSQVTRRLQGKRPVHSAAQSDTASTPAAAGSAGPADAQQPPAPRQVARQVVQAALTKAATLQTTSKAAAVNLASTRRSGTSPAAALPVQPVVPAVAASAVPPPAGPSQPAFSAGQRTRSRSAPGQPAPAAVQQPQPQHTKPPAKRSGPPRPAPATARQEAQQAAAPRPQRARSRTTLARAHTLGVPETPTAGELYSKHFDLSQQRFVQSRSEDIHAAVGLSIVR